MLGRCHKWKTRMLFCFVILIQIHRDEVKELLVQEQKASGSPYVVGNHAGWYFESWSWEHLEKGNHFPPLLRCRMKFHSAKTLSSIFIFEDLYYSGHKHFDQIMLCEYAVRRISKWPRSAVRYPAIRGMCMIYLLPENAGCKTFRGNSIGFVKWLRSFSSSSSILAYLSSRLPPFMLPGRWYVRHSLSRFKEDCSDLVHLGLHYLLWKVMQEYSQGICIGSLLHMNAF